MVPSDQGVLSEGEALVVNGLESSGCQRGSGDVAAELFERCAVASVDPGGGVEGESSRCEAQGSGADALRGVPQDTPEALAGPITGGHDTAQGSCRDGGQQRRLVVERIDLAVVEKTPFFTEPDDPAGRRLHDALDIGVGNCRRGHKDRFLLTVDVDAVEHEDVEVWVQVEGTAEALHECDRTAPGVGYPMARA